VRQLVRAEVAQNALGQAARLRYASVVTPTCNPELRAAIERALRAPSSHNSQPWQLVLRGAAIELRADDSRRLAVVDPDGRELLISCGALLLSLRCALEQLGYALRVELASPSVEAGWLARLHFLETPAGADRDPGSAALWEALERRQTHRGRFSDASLPADLVERMSSAAREYGVACVSFCGEARVQVAKLVADGDRLQWRDRAFREELALWMRANTSARGDGLFGYCMGMGDWPSRLAPWVVRRFDQGTAQARKDQRSVLEAPLAVALMSRSDAPADWIAVGQALQRILLLTAAEGVSAGFMNQPLQCRSLRPRLSALTGVPGHAQLLLLLGRAPLGKPSPRRAWSEVVAEA
jgi:nitroreductase